MASGEVVRQLCGATFVGHVQPPNGTKCELLYRFQASLDAVPAGAQVQRRSLGWPAAVACVSASCSIPVLGLDGEEVAVSLDAPGRDGSSRLLMQSLRRPDLGLTVLALAPDGQRLVGGDESWQPGQRPIISAARRDEAQQPGSPGGGLRGAGPAPALSPSARPPPGPGAPPPEAAAVTPVKPVPPSSGPRRPGSRSDSASRRAAAAGSPPAAPTSQPAFGSGAYPASAKPAAPAPAARAAREQAPAEPDYDGIDAVIGEDSLGRRPLVPGRAEAEAASRRRLAADRLEKSDGPRAPGAGPTSFDRPDLMVGEPRQAVDVAVADPAALDEEIKAADAAATERLVYAAAAGECGDVRKLLARLGPDRAVGAKAGGRFEGLTALMAAAARGRPEVVELLVEKQAKLELKDPNGWTALMHAIHSQRPECVQLLLDAKASPDAVAEADDCRTPLMMAAASARHEICASLIKAGAKREARDSEGLKALHYAAKKGNGGAIMALIAARAHVDDSDRFGMTPLLIASVAGRAEAVKMLLSHRADAGKEDAEGRVAAKLASIYEHDRVLQALNAAGG